MLKIAAPTRTVQAVLLMICASATISVLWALLRWGAETMHPIYMVFWRSLFGAIVLTPLLDPRSVQLVATLTRSGRFVVAVDTLGPITDAEGSGKWAEVANHMWRLERENLIGQLREHGVPVVAWAGSGSLNQVLRDVTRMAASPKVVGR